MADVTHECVLLGEGGQVDHTPSGADVAAGQVIVTNGMFQFATQPILEDVLGSVKVQGGQPTVRIVKVTGSLSVGDSVYWDDNGTVVGSTTALTGAVTTTSSGNTFVGRVIKAAGASIQTVDVQLSLGVVTQSDLGLTNDITDPGTGNAIPVTASGSIAITTAAAETNTLAIPTFIGQQLSIHVDVYAVGDRVVTVAAAINVANNTIMTFGAVSVSIILTAVQLAGTLVWQVTHNDGVTLS